MESGTWIAIVITGVVIAVVILLIREVWCWYWKINDILAVQQAMLEEIRSLRHHLVPTIPETGVDRTPTSGFGLPKKSETHEAAMPMPKDHPDYQEGN